MRNVWLNILVLNSVRSVVCNDVTKHAPCFDVVKIKQRSSGLACLVRF